MHSEPKHAYQELHQDALDSNEELRLPLRRHTLPIWLVVLITILVVGPSSFYFGRIWNAPRQFGVALDWSHDLTAMPVYNTKFEGSFEAVNEFRGEPSPQLDKAWARYTEHPIVSGTASVISVGLDDLQRSNKTSPEDWVNATVEYGDVNGGGYMATLGVFHQLHCLNMLRKYVHLDYYRNSDPLFNGSYPRTLTTHLDHCVEVLRQVLSCNADTGLIAFKWVRGNPVPYPDFNTWHQCRNPEDILQWAKSREAPIVKKVEKSLFPSITEMPNAP